MREVRGFHCRIFWFTLKEISPIYEAGVELDLNNFSVNMVPLP
jgi:hypothetical protein